MEPLPELVDDWKSPDLDLAQDLDSARVPARSTVGAAAVLATKPAGIEALAAENRRLKQAVECRELQKRKKLILKQQKLLERLQVKRALQLASAEHVELKQFAKAELKLRRETAEQHKLREEYDKIKFRLQCMDIELHTEGPNWNVSCGEWGGIKKYMRVGYKVVDHRTRMTQQDTLELRVFKKPFATGGCRLAYYAQDTNGVRYVAKSSLRQGKQLAGNVAEMEEDVNAHMMASQFAKAFNAALDAVQPHAKKLLFHDVHLVVLEDRTIPVGPQSALFLEPYLDGKFEKWHCNDGRVSQVQELLQAFSHFTYKHMQSLPTPEQGVVVDIQGVVQSDQFVLTDPAIHCTSDDRKYGDTNWGKEGVTAFFKEHTCNTVCHALGLPAWSAV